MRRARRRRGHALPYHVHTYVSGHVTIALQFDPKRHGYRGDLSWPEIDPSGRISPRIRHHLIKFSDAESRETAAREMLRDSGLLGTPVHPGAMR